MPSFTQIAYRSSIVRGSYAVLEATRPRPTVPPSESPVSGRSDFAKRPSGSFFLSRNKLYCDKHLTSVLLTTGGFPTADARYSGERLNFAMSPGDVYTGRELVSQLAASSEPLFRFRRGDYSAAETVAHGTLPILLAATDATRGVLAARPVPVAAAAAVSLKDAERSFATHANAPAPFGNSYPGT